MQVLHQCRQAYRCQRSLLELAEYSGLAEGVDSLVEPTSVRLDLYDGNQ